MDWVEVEYWEVPNGVKMAAKVFSKGFLLLVAFQFLLPEGQGRSILGHLK